MDKLIKYSINKEYNELNKIIKTIQISSYSITNMIEPFTHIIINSLDLMIKKVIINTKNYIC